MATTTTVNWSAELADQLAWHWDNQLRPRLSGLTDEEYLWEPAPGSWSVRPRGEGVAMEVGSGDFIIDFSMPEPVPPPLTTIAWRLGHLLVGVLGARNAAYFDGPAIGYDSYAYPGTAQAALVELDAMVNRWLGGVRGLSEDQLAARCQEEGHEEDSMAALVLHIHREMIHHGAEVSLLRDLFRATRSSE